MYYSYILSVLNSSHVAFSGHNGGSRVSECNVCIQTGWIKFCSVQKQYRMCVCVCVCACVCVQNAFPHLDGALHTRAHTI